MLALILFASSSCLSQVHAQGKVDSRTVEMEKKRLKEELNRCDHLFDGDQRHKSELEEVCQNAIKADLRELEKDPDYYFYKNFVVPGSR